MFKIGIVGDVHIATSVSSRKDNYFETCMNKIKEVSENCKNVIFLGDIFNTPTIPNNYFIELYTTLNYLKTVNGNNFYSIVGNHDVYQEREESLNKTSLGLCDTLGIIKLILPDKPVTIDNFTFYSTYVNLKKAKEDLKEKKFNENDILLLHHYFEDRYEGFKYEELKELGCKKIFFGHEHLPFEGFRKEYNEFTAYRCGSLLRNNAGTANLKRDIFYYIINDEDIVQIAKLDCMKKAEDVFTEKAFTQENLQKKQFLTDINDVIQKYTNNISTKNCFSIKNILEELKANDKVIQYIEDKYTLVGTTFI